MRLKDLSGEKFGKLTVIKRAPNRNNRTMWLCECECGNKTVVGGAMLKSGNTKSCGCLKNNHKYENIVGNKYGKLTVVSFSHMAPGYNAMWNCRCECGGSCVVAAKNLKSGKQESCGCSRSNKRKSTEIIRRDGYCIGITNSGTEFMFDEDDIDIVSCRTWYLGLNGYVSSKTTKESVALHRLVLGLSDGAEDERGKILVDHINGNTLDNRKQNLRTCSYKENAMNKNAASSNTGVVGVSYIQSEDVYIASLYKDGEAKLYSRHKNIDDAIYARVEAERRYFGEFAPKREE